MEFQILGSLVVRADGCDVPLGAAKPRTLLLRLLVARGRAVLAERLIDDLWETEPPTSAAQTLQGYVSQLRKRLGPERLETRSGGYRLVIHQGELDVDAFEADFAEGRQAVGRGQPQAGIVCLERALERWRGPPLADAMVAAWALPEISRLDELHLVALETLFEARLALGHDVEVAAETEAAVAEHPMRERLWASLITALYRQGRQAEALRAFQRLRQHLTEELGIDPSPELQALEHHVLTQDPSLAGSALSDPGASTPLPSGVVTFLLTDVVGSTGLWDSHPNEMAQALAQHDAIIRGAVEASGGVLLKARGEGDSTFSVFGRATDAVAAAQAARLALINQAWPDGVRFEVRMALHTGEVQERDGDYFGPAVNRAARLMAAGHGGQVLLSSVTAELVPDLVARNLGEHRLRDLSSPMSIWQLGGGEFPPLRALDVLPGNLPTQRTSFVGRIDEVDQLTKLIETERLVTLTGPGGVGKSRLALQVAAEVAPNFTGGAWFASLASLEEPSLIAATILESLGVPERQGEPALDTLAGWGKAREALIVIDNCEHLLDAVAAIADRLVDVSETVHVVVTSQAPLGVRGEHVWNVAPLAGPGEPARDSVELFVDRARLARAEFTLTSDNEATVIEICQGLDHVPLAIELAAARVRGMTPTDIARRLNQRLQLLASSDRLAPERHRTLDAAVRWSYDLLDEAPQKVFDRLSVFAGPFTVEAAEVVTGGNGVDQWEILDGILALVDKSLVVVDETAAETRYRLLETMRQFGYANLAEAGVAASYRARHADYYADYVLSRKPQLHGAGDQAALDEVERELENIRLALRQAADDHGSSRFEDLSSSVYVLWIGRGRLSEGTAWAAELRARPDADAAARIVALGFGAAVCNSNNLALARELAYSAIDQAKATGAAQALLAVAVIALGAMMQGNSAEAIAACDQVIASSADEPDRFIRFEALNFATATVTVCGALDRLDALLPILNELAEVIGSEYQLAAYANSMSPIIHLTEPEHTGEYLLRGYQRTEDIGNYHALSTTAMFLALHELRSGRMVAAAEWNARALELAIAHAPAFIAQSTSAAIAIFRRQSPTEAALLLGALSAYRKRRRQAGSPPEMEAEARYEASLRRRLGDAFDARYAEGQRLDEAAMINLAFEQLAEIAKA